MHWRTWYSRRMFCCSSCNFYHDTSSMYFSDFRGILLTARKVLKVICVFQWSITAQYSDSSCFTISSPWLHLFLYSVNLILFTLPVHLLLHTSPHHSLCLHSHHISLPRHFTPDLKPLCSTNPLFHNLWLHLDWLHWFWTRTGLTWHWSLF